MALWRPPQSIRTKVIGLAWQQASLLAVEVERDDGSVKGVRPPGGSIQFGETREEALRREFREELGSEIALLGNWHVFENIYRHEGMLGHELIFAVDVTLADKDLYGREEILFCEDNGIACRARWFDPQALRATGLELYPTGLENHVKSLMRELPG
jgi:ADP-ribose pyrophosphatase YjhB (NUDIX family)